MIALYRAASRAMGVRTKGRAASAFWRDAVEKLLRAGCGNAFVLIVLFFLLWWLLAPTAVWLLERVLTFLGSL